MTYVSLTVDIAAEHVDALEALLYECEASGLEVRDSDCLPMPNVRAPSKGEAIVVAFFPEEDLAEVAHNQVNIAFPKAKLELEKVATKDWSVEWRNQIKSVRVGRLWVGPPWEDIPKDAVSLVIEPKMAFGTGDHPTTSLCLEAVDQFLLQCPQASVLDVGTGTGILALAAKKLGASKVVATDNDPVSVQLAQENADSNQVRGVEISQKNLDQIDGTFDLVVANILANALIELAPLIVPKVKNRLVLAGVLTGQKNEVTSALTALGLKALPDKQINEWVRIELQKE